MIGLKMVAKFSDLDKLKPTAWLRAIVGGKKTYLSIQEVCRMRPLQI